MGLIMRCHADDFRMVVKRGMQILKNETATIRFAEKTPQAARPSNEHSNEHSFSLGRPAWRVTFIL